jgi:hypothetical protein
MTMKRELILAALSLATVSIPVRADTRSDILAAFNRCGVFSDNRTWLNCVYGAVEPMRSELGLPPAPASQTNLVPNATPMPQIAPPSAPAPAPARRNDSGGGFFSFLLGGQPILTNVPLTSYSVDHDGLFTITLSNGQVWREQEGSPTPHWHGPASGYVASISKGALDSDNLMIVGEGITYKAKRVR